MSDDRIIYNGVSMTPDWPERIREAQEILSVKIDGTVYSRIRHGDEKQDWGAERVACRDCGAVKGQFHVPNCDVERCPKCGGQIISCDCGDAETI
jgi:hypothetical protein